MHGTDRFIGGGMDGTARFIGGGMDKLLKEGPRLEMFWMGVG